MKPPHTAPPDGSAGRTDAPMLPPAAPAVRPSSLSLPERESRAVGAIARNIGAALSPPGGGDPDTMLTGQARVLDALFRQLMLCDAAGESFDERFGLALALRAQKQCRHTIESMSIMQARRDPLRRK